MANRKAVPLPDHHSKYRWYTAYWMARISEVAYHRRSKQDSSPNETKIQEALQEEAAGFLEVRGVQSQELAGHHRDPPRLRRRCDARHRRSRGLVGQPPRLAEGVPLRQRTRRFQTRDRRYLGEHAARMTSGGGAVFLTATREPSRIYWSEMSTESRTTPSRSTATRSTRGGTRSWADRNHLNPRGTRVPTIGADLAAGEIQG